MKNLSVLVSISAVILVTISAVAQIPVFRDIAVYAGVNNPDIGMGAAFVDINNDGAYDIYLINDSQQHEYDHMYLNRGNCTFRDVTLNTGLGLPPFSNSVRVIDFDNDGWQDMMVTTMNTPDGTYLFRNRGTGAFANYFPQSGLANHDYSCSDWCDFNNDGLLDVYFLSIYSYQLDALWQNNGFGVFSSVWQSGGSYFYGCDAQFCDLDNDRDLDLFQAVYGYERLFENQYPQFVEIGHQAGIQGNLFDFSYPLFGDYNNDGMFDIFVINYEEYLNSPDRLYKQMNSMEFQDYIAQSGIDAWDETSSGLWGDFDNDGWLDLLTISWNNVTRLWLNNGDETFTDAAPAAGLTLSNSGTYGLAWGDINNDGFLDIYLARDGINRLYYNNGNTNHWLQVELQGTSSNRLGIGARAKAVAGDLVQWRDWGGGKWHSSSNAPFIHFGLAENTIVDSLFIYWPSGNNTVLTGVSTNQRISVTETAEGELALADRSMIIDDFMLLNCYPNPFNAALNIKFSLASAGEVKLTVYNLLGERIAQLVDSYMPSGEQYAQFSGERLSSGEYFIRLQTEDAVVTKKVVLLK